MVNIDRYNPHKKNWGGIPNNFYESKGVLKLKSLRATAKVLSTPKTFCFSYLKTWPSQGAEPYCISVLVLGLLMVCDMGVQLKSLDIKGRPGCVTNKLYRLGAVTELF